MFTRCWSLGVFTGVLVSDSGFSQRGCCARRRVFNPCYTFKHKEGFSLKAVGFGRVPLLCSDVLALEWCVTERENQARLSRLPRSPFALLAFADLLFAAVRCGLAHVGIGPRAICGLSLHFPPALPSFSAMGVKVQ